MNIERILMMIFRRVIGRLVNLGVDKGIDMAARRGGREPQPQQQMTPDERQRAKQAKESAKRARQASKMMRRMR